jgi:hypothetical protein
MGGSEMSDTPETDAAEYLISVARKNDEWFVRSDFARKLERERDEAREALRTAVQERHDFHWELLDAVRERDEARKETEEQARLLGMSAQREADLLGKLDRLKRAANNVILQWDSPSWKLTEPTAGVIYRLRDALEIEKE